MTQILTFRDRKELRNWLNDNFDSTESIWIRLKKADNTGLKASEALEEALCFGWIDSIVKREDDTFYLKKFSKRRDNSTWSEINKTLAEKLIKEGGMAGPGLRAVETAKKNGRWDNVKETPEITDVLINELRDRLRADEEICLKFDHLNPSSRKMLTAYYYDAKKHETRERRLKHIIEGIQKGSFLF